ncbi:MAG TPA: 5'-methylthioadenosine/S-adenosylhomocysteine nucleosidase [Acidobacteriota bacterium]|jgi:adenosylhomocysteine nucleosidase
MLTGCDFQGQKTPARRPVVVQGAMPEETALLAGRLRDVRVERIGGWTFWRGTVDGYPVIVSKTLKGMSNAAAATAIAAERYRPAAIINQGTSGGHVVQLHVYDIVLGRGAVHLGAFKTAHRGLGQGSNSLEWEPLDLMFSESSAGQDPNARGARRFPADRRLLAAAESVKHRYRHGQVVAGVIGTSELWNSELDRIQRFNREFGTSVEEMETAAAAQVAKRFQIPFLGIRVLSNNIVNEEPYDPKAAGACQEYVYEVIKAVIERFPGSEVKVPAQQ